MQDFDFLFKTSDLASRTTAKGYRLDIEKSVKEGHVVRLDFQKVEAISDSFGDELFGILALTLGLERFNDRVKLVNAKPVILRRIARNINCRLSPSAHA